MKLALKIIAAVVGLIIIAVLALILFFDLNRLKPHIESAARAQGVALHIGGDLGWTFWPSIGVAVEDIRVAALAAPEQPIAQLEQASLMVALLPLFSGNIEVDHVRVTGAAIELAVDEQGSGNWEALTADADAADVSPTSPAKSSPDTSPSPTPPAASDAREFTLAVDRISLLKSSLNYRDAQSGQHIAVEDIELDIRQFNLQGDPFDMTLALTTRLTNEQPAASTPLQLALDASQRVQLSPQLDRIEISDGRVDVVLNQDGKARLNYQLTAEDLQENSRYSGELDVPAFNARKLLAAMGVELQTRENYALSDLSLKASIVGDKQQLTMKPLQLTLDKTTVSGSLAITDIAANALRVVLQGDAINVDDYLAPEQETATAPAVGSGDEELIPLQTIRELNADIRVDFGKVTVADIPLENIQFHVTANNGLVSLQQGDAQVYQGQITSQGSLDGRGNTAVIRVDGKISEVQLAPALKDFELDERVQISGAINADTTASLRGVTLNQLMDSLTGEANFSGDQIRFAPLNIEQKFCQLVNLVNQQPDPQRDWEAFTEMRELTGKATISQQVITVESFNAGVHQLLLGVQGQLNLAASEYDFILPLKLLDEESSAQGCRVNSNYWIDRSLSLLRCRGSLDTVNPVSDCRPDSKGLTSLTKDFVEYKLREKHGDKIDAAEQKLDAKKDELRQKLDEKLGTETEGQKPRDLLKGLLNRKLEERNRDESAQKSSVPAETSVDEQTAQPEQAPQEEPASTP